MGQEHFDSLIWRVHDYHPEIIKRVVYSIPDLIVQNPESTYADLAMGGGQFLQGVLNRCIELGQSREQILPRLYGFERSKVYLNYARWRNNLQGVNLAILDPERDLDSVSMKFDVVIGNPPYQETSGSGRKDQASNLWTKFWIKSLELCGDDGYVSLITPTSWLSPSANLKGCYKYQGHSRLWDVFDSYTSVAQVTDVGTFFKGVGSSFGVVGVNKNGNKGLSFVEGYDTSLGFLPKSNTQEVINKLGGPTTLGSEFKVSQTPGSGWRVSVPLTRKVAENSIEILQGEELPSSGSLKPGLYLYVYVSSEAEATSVKGTLIPCMDLLNTYCRWSGFMNIKIFTMISHNKQ